MEFVSTKTLFLLCIMLVLTVAESDTFKVAVTYKNVAGAKTVRIKTLEDGKILVEKLFQTTELLTERTTYQITTAKLNSKKKRVELVSENDEKGTPHHLDNVLFYIKHKQLDGLKFVKWLSKCWEEKKIKTNSTFIQGYAKYDDNALEMDMGKFSKGTHSYQCLKMSLDYKKVSRSSRSRELKSLEVVMLKTEDGKRNFRNGFSPQDKTIITSIAAPSSYGNQSRYIKVTFTTRSGKVIDRWIKDDTKKCLEFGTDQIANFLKTVYAHNSKVFKDWDMRSLLAFNIEGAETTLLRTSRRSIV